MDKKAILKKYTGKGGIVRDTIKEIPGTLRGMGKNLSKGLDPAGLVSKGISGIKRGANAFVAPLIRYNKIQEGIDAKQKQDFDAKTAPREKDPAYLDISANAKKKAALKIGVGMGKGQGLAHRSTRANRA